MKKRLMSWLLCASITLSLTSSYVPAAEPVQQDSLETITTEVTAEDVVTEVETEPDNSMDTVVMTETKPADVEMVTVEEQPAPTATNLVISPASTIALGQSFTLEGEASIPDRVDTSYRYIYYDNVTWRELYSSDHVETFVWTPDTVGSYVICYQIICGNSVSNYMKSVTVEEPEFTFKGCKTSGDTSIIIEPQFTTNLLPEQYTLSYLIYDLDLAKWSNLKTNTQDLTCEWKPAKSGTYWIYVYATDETGVIYKDNTNYCMGYVVNPPHITGLTVDKVSPQVVKSNITLTGKVNNPVGETLTYEYLSYDGKYWASLSKESELTSCEVYLDKAGDFLYCFQIYNESNEVLGQWFTSFTVEPFQIKTGNLVVEENAAGGFELSATGSSTDPDAEYKWSYYDIEKGTWGLLKDWSGEMTTSWKPTHTGSYWLNFEGRTSTGEKASTLITYTIKDISITSFTADYTAPEAVKNPITLSGTVNNPLSQKLTFQYLAYDGEYWNELYSSDTLEDYVWTPEKAGSYLLCLQVTDDNGKIYQSFMGYQIENITVEFKSLQMYTPDNKVFDIRQYYETNDRGIQCRYLIYDLQQEAWFEIGVGNSCKWTPTASGSYWVHTELTTSEGKVYTTTNGYQYKGFKIKEFGFGRNLKAGREETLTFKGENYLNEGYNVSIQMQVGDSWQEVFSGRDTEFAEYKWTPAAQGYYVFVCRVTDDNGTVIDEYNLHITPKNFSKNGWYYEDGYKFYYINGVKQLDLDGILPKQSTYIAKVNRVTCTVTIYAKDGDNGYIIPVKRFACSVGLPSTPTPKGTFYTTNKYRWHTLMGPSYGQYCTRIVGGILFHSVAGYNKTSYNISASAFNKLGSPASHGCVRLCVRDAKWIYDNCKSGMQVTIYDSSYAGPLGQGPIVRIPAGQNWDPTDPNI